MHPIGAMIPICGGLTEEQYCASYPYPVLLMQAQQNLSRVENPNSATIERIVLVPEESAAQDAMSTTRATERPAPTHMYFVFPLAPKTTPATTLVLGCSPDCDVQIDDRSISKIHAVFKTDAGRTFVKDNDSTSGTQINGETLVPKKWRELVTGDCLSLGFVDTIFLPPLDFYNFVRRLFID